MWIYALIPFCLQALAIGVDEGYFHVRRGLPKWEQIGHPLDTLSYLICLLVVLYAPFNTTNLYIYCGLAILSCLMVTKDEFIHKEHCPGAENWLHALLFILHPLVLILTGLIWSVTQGLESFSWLDNSVGLTLFLELQTAAVFIFFLYQVIFWNIIWKNVPATKH